MKTKAIIFDMNGVFIKDAGPLSERIKIDFSLDVGEFQKLLWSSLKQVRIPGNTNTSVAWQPVLKYLNLSYEDFFKYWFEGESLNSDLLDLAMSLRQQGVKIIILSNNFPERTNHYRKTYPELFDQVDEQYFSWETGKVKPSIEAYSQILDRHDFHPGEYLYFDDKQENLDVASNLGIRSHLYQGLEDAIKFITTNQNV